ncbi:MAG: hypothetical protein U1E28_08240 [Beijerinckiaceae bacterium]
MAEDAGRETERLKDDRIRILEFQVDHLRRELEDLEARHAEAIYSVAWHVGWPVRIVERAIRRLFSRRDDDGSAPGAGGSSQASPSLTKPPPPISRDRIAARISARIARPA